MTKSREIRQKILKIMDLALKISPPDVEKVKGTPDVFVKYSPHYFVLEVEVYKCGWKYDCDSNDRSFILITSKDASKELDEVIEHLQDLREEINNVSKN